MKNKIIDFEIFEAKVTNKTNWIFLKLKNKHNIIGWGEATLQGKEKQLFEIKNKILKIIINKEYSSPYDLKSLLPFENIIQSSISSSIMQAIWDIQGKIEKKSIGSIFGRKNDLIQVYANFNRSTVDRTISGIKSKTTELLNNKFDFVKFAPFDEVKPNMLKKNFVSALDSGLDRINIIRETLGKNIKILIDCHWRFDYQKALELIRECESFNLFWIECPLIENSKNINEIKLIRGKANNKGIKLAGLEKKILKEGFCEYLKSGSYDVMMPDVKYAGGPDEMLEIEKLFNKFSVEFSPHNPSGPISHAHSLQVCSATFKEALMEHQFKETPHFKTLLENPNPEIKSGRSSIPNFCNGLGVTINEKSLSKISL